MSDQLKVYSEAEIQAKLAQELPGWFLEGKWIQRQYKTDGWPATLMLVNTIGYVAEAAFHHPDLEVSWAKVGVKLQTHSAAGVTDKDFELAKKIESVVLWRPEPDSVFKGGTPNKWVRAG
ncbi:MAG: 4a-hydroxytetrahydrobiopterin dehydratase [Chloroflexota bacterium]